MRRRSLLLITFFVPLFFPPAFAQSQEKIWRVSVLTQNQFGARAIRQFNLPELARLGFVEGRNLSFHVFSADEVSERLPSLATELVAAKPDVILGVGPGAIRAARAATSTIPIVMSYGGEDPIAAGWAQSYARPGGNITGVVLLSPELDSKRLSFLHSILPGKRIAVLFHNRSLNTPTDRAIHMTAKQIGIDVLSFYTAGAQDYEATFNAIRLSGAEALQIASSGTFANDAAVLAELALKAGLPTICEWRDMAGKGCLIAYGVDRAALQRRVADFVVRIFRGAAAAELPIEDPTAFELAINLKTAKTLHIDIPSQLLARADEVIE